MIHDTPISSTVAHYDEFSGKKRIAYVVNYVMGASYFKTRFVIAVRITQKVTLMTQK